MGIDDLARSMHSQCIDQIRLCVWCFCKYLSRFVPVTPRGPFGHQLKTVKHSFILNNFLSLKGTHLIVSGAVAGLPQHWRALTPETRRNIASSKRRPCKGRMCTFRTTHLSPTGTKLYFQTYRRDAPGRYCIRPFQGLIWLVKARAINWSRVISSRSAIDLA